MSNRVRCKIYLTVSGAGLARRVEVNCHELRHIIPQKCLCLFIEGLTLTKFEEFLKWRFKPHHMPDEQIKAFLKNGTKLSPYFSAIDLNPKAASA